MCRAQLLSRLLQGCRPNPDPPKRAFNTTLQPVPDAKNCTHPPGWGMSVSFRDRVGRGGAACSGTGRATEVAVGPLCTLAGAGRGRLGRAQGIRPQGERKGRGVGSQECSIICGKELKSLRRLLRVLPRSQLSKFCSGDTPALAASPARASPEAQSPGGGSRARGLRFPPPYHWRRDAAAGTACCWLPLFGSRESP